jgi:hypothetical protein
VVVAFAGDRLAAARGEAQNAHLAHAGHYAGVVAGWDAAIRQGSMSYAAPHEWENVAHAVEWLASRMASAVTDKAVVQALLAFTRNWRNVLFNHHDPRRRRWLATSVAAARRAGDPWDLANVLKAQGDVLYFLKQTTEALGKYEEALGLYRSVGARLGEASVLKAQGGLALSMGEDERGMALLNRARQLYTVVGDRVGPTNIGITLAFHAAERGDLTAAIAHLQPAAQFCMAIGHPLGAQLQAQIATWQGQINL